MNRRSAQHSAYRIALSGLLVALMLVLGYVESLIPISSAVPGIKLGLSNSILIFAVYMLDIPAAYCLMALKVLLSGLMFGGVSAMAYAFAGGLLSLTAMCLLSRVKGIHPVVVSLLGGVMHNMGQVGLAMLILNTNMLGYMAVLVLAGCGFGVLTGVSAAAVMRHLRTMGWKTAMPKSKNGWVMIVLALALIALVGFQCWETLSAQRQAAQNVQIITTAPVTSDPLADLLNGQPTP